jgi:hypothetical protein
MQICDLDYLELVSETSTMHLNGGKAVAISAFSASAFGDATSINTFLRNLAISGSNGSLANSSVHIASISSGGSTFAYASSLAYVSSSP